ncbi:PREDICTED: protein FAM205A [Chinchilla lanigera]|uniref:Protein FAM205A n=1 Tax=Chinchilla lanigera TaxID=34839 RepID=A0A8C2UKV3_CHILA|nr:PREDICTED: protein FAM205A [Chinchilla lanigera]
MLTPSLVVENIGYLLYSYGSIFIIILLIWQVKRSYYGLRFKPKRNCCRCHRKIRQRARDAASRAKRCPRKEAKKLWDLLSTMKSQHWLPQQESVRQLLCADPSCQTCNAVCLEIQQLLEDEKSQVSPTLSGPLQGSSYLQMMSMSTVSSEKNREPHPQRSRDLLRISATPALSQQMEQDLTPTIDDISIQEYFTDHLQRGQEFQWANTPVVQESRDSSELQEPMVPVSGQEMMQNKPNLVQGNQRQHHVKCRVSLPSLHPEFPDNLTRPMTLHVDSVFPAHLPFFRPKVLRLLEGHVKKRKHFQMWGLPRRVEDSFMRQLMPDAILFSKIGKNLQLSSILNSTSKVACDKIGIIAQQTWCSYITREPIQSIWVSEWSSTKPQQRHYYQQVQNYDTLALPSPPAEVFTGLCLPLGGQADDPGSHLHQKHRQLFCGLPSLHSESLTASFLSSEGLATNTNTSRPPSKEPLLLQGLSFHPLLPETPPDVCLPSSPLSPNRVSPAGHPEAHVSAPFLTPAEYKTLEWHLLQRQLQLRWGLPAIIQRCCHAHSPKQSEPCDEAQAPETVQTSWPGKPVSVFTRKLPFFPEHTHRLLEFHFQKQLIRLRWGLPEKIQQSFQLLLSSADQQTLPCSSTTFPRVQIPHPTALKGTGDGDPFSPMLAQMSLPMPHLLTQAKAKLQGHIDSKCGQIHQGMVPCHVSSSWEGTAPGGVAVAPFPCVPQGQPRGLQAASDSDLHDRVTPWGPRALGQQKQASPDTAAGRPKLHRALTSAAMERLEMTVRHKYLVFLSGLPTLYSSALSEVTAPAIASHSPAAGMAPGPVEAPKEPLAQVTTPQDPSRRLGPCFQNDSETRADSTDSQPEVQREGTMESAPPESQTHPAILHAFKTRLVSRLHFHLRKKVLEIKLGLPIRARESREQTTAGPENKSSRARLTSQNKQGSTVLQKLPAPPDSLPAPHSERVHLEEHPASQLQTLRHSPKPPGSEAAPLAPSHQPSEISQVSGDVTEAQVLCVQVEAAVNSPGLGEHWDPEPQRAGKGSAHIPTPAGKREEAGKPQAAGDLGEGDAGLGHSLTSAERHPEEEQKPEEMLLKRRPQGSWRWTHSCLLVDPQQHTPQYHPQLKLAEPPTELPGRKESEHDMQDHGRNVSALLTPAKVPENFHPAVGQASQGQPFPGQPTPHKPFKGQTLQSRVLQGQVTPARSHKRPSPPESGLVSKMKFFVHYISAVTKDKNHADSMLSTPGKAANTSKENVERRLVPAKSPTEKTRTDTPGRSPKNPSLPTERPVGLASSDVSHSPHSKLRLRSQLRGSASVPGHPHHCPRHCPGVAVPSNQGNRP